MEHSVACLEAKANVCCVKFNPESRYHLSFGSAGIYKCNMVIYWDNNIFYNMIHFVTQLLTLQR